MRRRSILLAPLVLAVPAAQAQTPPRRIRGKIASLDGRTLVVTTREGPNLTITLAENLVVTEVTKLELDAIQPNAFVGVASIHRGDQDIALEVLVFPEAARGSGEGSYPWDLTPESTMTNATVATVEKSATGRTLALTYKDGKRSIMVPPEAPIVTFTPADRSLLVAGAPVFLGAAVAADGSLSAGRIVTGRNGLAPPM